MPDSPARASISEQIPEFETPQIRRILESMASEIRDHVYRGHYSCLRSFLHAVGTKLRAEAAGAYHYDLRTGALNLKRAVTVGQGDPQTQNSGEEKFYQYEGVFRRISEASSQADLNYSIDESTENGGCIVCRRVWPSEDWVDSEEKSVWVYFILRKQSIVHPRTNNGSDFVSRQIATLAGTWFRWKNEIWAELRATLVGCTSIEDAISQIDMINDEKGGIRPIEPKQFYEILNRLQEIESTQHEKEKSKDDSLPIGNESQPEAVDHDATQVVRSLVNALATCSGERDGGNLSSGCGKMGNIKGFCPQSAEISASLTAMAWGHALAKGIRVEPKEACDALDQLAQSLQKT